MAAGTVPAAGLGTATGVRVSERTRESILASIVSDYAWWRFSDGTDENVALDSNVLSATDLTGTVGTFWSADLGFVTFDGSLHFIEDVTAAAKSFAELQGRTGHMLVNFRMKRTANQASDSALISHSMGGAPAVGWWIAFGATSVNFTIRDSQVRGMGNHNILSLNDGQNYSFFLDVDFTNLDTQWYVDGTAVGVGGDLTELDDALSDLDQASGLVVGGRSRSSAPNNLFNASTGDMAVSDLFVMFPTVPLTTAELSAIAVGWSKRPHELPFEIIGL